jgi:hypothetical protein
MPETLPIGRSTRYLQGQSSGLDEPVPTSEHVNVYISILTLPFIVLGNALSRPMLRLGWRGAPIRTEISVIIYSKVSMASSKSRGDFKARDPTSRHQRWFPPGGALPPQPRLRWRLAPKPAVPGGGDFPGAGLWRPLGSSRSTVFEDAALASPAVLRTAPDLHEPRCIAT